MLTTIAHILKSTIFREIHSKVFACDFILMCIRFVGSLSLYNIAMDTSPFILVFILIYLSLTFIEVFALVVPLDEHFSDHTTAMVLRRSVIVIHIVLPQLLYYLLIDVVSDARVGAAWALSTTPALFILSLLVYYAPPWCINKSKGGDIILE